MDYKLGKKLATPNRAFHLSRYRANYAHLTPAHAVDRSAAVARWGVLGNDYVGDCTAAAAAHAIMLWTAVARHPIIVTNVETLAFYERFGFNPLAALPDGSNPTDLGANPQAVLQLWSTSGFPLGNVKDVLNGFCAVTPTNAFDVRFSVCFLGVLYAGIMLPRGIEDAFSDTSVVWDLPPGTSLAGDWAPGSLGGHAIPIVGYDLTSLTFISWGRKYRMTWAFWHAYADEAYGLLSRDFASDLVPAEGWTTLEGDMQQLRGDE